MPGNTFGHLFRITTAGESHGAGNVVIIDGVPAGLELSVDDLRPDLADFTFDAKYGFRDYRGGGRSSARETNVRVAAGAVAKKMLLQLHGIRIVGYVKQVGTIAANIPDPAAVTLE